MLEGLVDGETLLRIHHDQVLDEVFGFEGDRSPIFGMEGKLARDHMPAQSTQLVGRKWRITAQQDVEYDSKRPHVYRGAAGFPTDK